MLDELLTTTTLETICTCKSMPLCSEAVMCFASHWCEYAFLYLSVSIMCLHAVGSCAQVPIRFEPRCVHVQVSFLSVRILCLVCVCIPVSALSPMHLCNLVSCPLFLCLASVYPCLSFQAYVCFASSVDRMHAFLLAIQ